MRIRGMLAGVALLMSMLSGCTRGSSSPQVSPTPPPTTPTASASILRLGSRVSVSVSGIQGEAGSQLAGILFMGHETSYPDFHPVGGFAAVVDANPFSTTETLRQPAPGDEGTQFPFVTDNVLDVVPGTYTIALYVGPTLRPIPYSHWRPFGTPGLKGCKMTFVVADGKGSMIVRMHDPALAEWSGDREDRWAPWHEHPPSCMGT